MKVLHVTQVFLPYRGGSTIRMLNLLNHTAKIINIEQHVLVTRKNVASDCKSYDIYDSIHVHRVQSFYDMPLAFMKLNRRYRFDIIHIHNPRPYWFVRPFALGMPVIMELHALQPLAWYKEALAQISYHWSDRIIVLSEAAKKYLKLNKSISDSKVVVVNNGVDYKRFEEAGFVKRVSEPANSSPKIGYIGTFYRWQGIFELLESARFVLKKIPNATFTFIGDGPEKEAFKKRVWEISEKNIQVFDQIAPHEVPGSIASLSLFCMLRPKTRATELTLPLKIFEVGMSNTPLLVSDLPGLLEAGGNNPEMFFNVQDDLSPQAVADRIVNLLDEGNVPLLRRKAQAYYEYLNRSDFSWKKSAEILKDTYTGLLSESR